jgi:peptide/nickel transport system substrate-binding protein
VYRSASRLTVLLAVASGLLGCGGGRPRVPAEPVRVGLYAAPLSLDPHIENDFLTSGVLANAFEGLTGLDADLRVEPALAISWDTPGATTWRFRLRPGARFQDGRAVEAADVVWSLGGRGGTPGAGSPTTWPTSWTCAHPPPASWRSEPKPPAPSC